MADIKDWMSLANPDPEWEQVSVLVCKLFTLADRALLHRRSRRNWEVKLQT